jgi:hypothetical protein
MSGRESEHEQVCLYLRAKISGAAHNDRRALHALQNEATTVYWCLLTMSPAGPDDGLVHASRCSRGRACCTVDEDQGVA